MIYDIDVPCVVQREMLWYSAPTSLNIDLEPYFFLFFNGHQRILHSSIPEKTYAKNFLLEGTRFDDEELVVAMGVEGDDWMEAWRKT